MRIPLKWPFAWVSALLATHSVSAQDYTFKGGYPTPETVQKAYDDADLVRAIEAYNFFYPTVSILGTWTSNINAGTKPNEVLLLLHGMPKQLVFTPNSDTPCAGGPVDLSQGPLVMEMPPGPLMAVVVNDLIRVITSPQRIGGDD